MFLERILRSRAFVVSPQLSRFLRHIVEGALSGETTLLKESTLGVAVFNRPVGYDTKADPIVRVEARRLRSRLEAYYLAEGADDEVHIRLPKGSYLPQFAPRPVAPPLPLPPPAARVNRLALPALGGAVVLALAVFALLRFTAPAPLPSRFWTSLLGGSQPVMVVPADSSLVTYQHITRRAVSLEEYVTGEYRNRTDGANPAAAELLPYLNARRYTSIADLEFATRLARRPEAARPGLLTRYSRDVQMADLKSHSVILLGSRHSNPWVELFEPESTLQIVHDEVSHSFELINKTPQGQERPRIFVPDVQREAYAIVCYHHKPDGDGRFLLLAGMTVAGTEAAADFVLNDHLLAPWLQKAALGGDLRGFDILLSITNVAGRGQTSQVAAFHLDR